MGKWKIILTTGKSVTINGTECSVHVGQTHPADYVEISNKGKIVAVIPWHSVVAVIVESAIRADRRRSSRPRLATDQRGHRGDPTTPESPSREV